MEDYEKFEVEGLTVRIITDPDPMNPRKEYDNAAHMVCFHRRYDLGDKHNMSAEEAKEFVERIKKQGAAVLNLYLYDHSGITMRTSPFSCPWDSGQVGFIYMERKDILNNWGVKRMTKKLFMQAVQLMEGEVETYDQYLTGDVYGFVIEDADGEELDSCWGHYGLKWAKEAATDSAKVHAAYIAEQVAKGETDKQKKEAEYNA
jgi:hypothetical protein